jgi:hypothetical protein
MCQGGFRDRFLRAAAGVDRRAVFQEWMQADMASAAQFVRSWDGGAERQSLLYSAVERWARDNPHAASQFVQGVQPTETAAALLVPLLLEWSRKDGPAAAAWASLLPECGGKSEVSVTSMAGHSTLEGTRWCRVDALATVGFGWARVDAPAALAWAQALKPDDVQLTVIDKIRASRRYP